MGFVKYRIRIKDEAIIGDRIHNNAAIYFDYNPPVLTNTAVNTLALPDAIFNASGDPAGIRVYPNPADDAVYIEILHPDILCDGSEMLILFDMQGRIMRKILLQSTGMKIDISEFSSGLYILTLNAAQGVYNYKMIVK